MSGPDTAYTTDGLRAGSSTAASTADAAGAVAGRVAGVIVDPTAFGDVRRAAAVAGALTACRDGVAALAGEVQRVHQDLAGRAGAVAGMGDRLTTDTTAEAARVALGP